MTEDKQFELQIQKLSDILEEMLSTMRENRKTALDNYESLREQLDKILSQDIMMSEDGKIESEVNKALKIVIESGSQLEKVLDVISKLLTVQLNNQSREKIASKLINGDKVITGPMSFKEILGNEEK